MLYMSAILINCSGVVTSFRKNSKVLPRGETTIRLISDVHVHVSQSGRDADFIKLCILNLQSKVHEAN